MRGFLDLPYRLPFARHYAEFDRGFYVDFPKQLAVMGRWLRKHGCRLTLDVGAMTGGCIEYITKLGIRMDGVLFTPDLKRLAAERLRKSRVHSRLFVSPVHAPLRLPGRPRYDGIVSLGWFNLPLPAARVRAHLAGIRRALRPGGAFLFDFFSFRELVVPPSKAVKLAAGLVLVSHAERLGKVLRRTHLWIRGGRDLRAEASDLVDRTPREARGFLEAAGFEVLRAEQLDLHYPREFWMARKRPLLKARTGRGGRAR
jgi:SAM-dependent methyltransferase